jgi:hypothetical protein
VETFVLSFWKTSVWKQMQVWGIDEVPDPSGSDFGHLILMFDKCTANRETSRVDADRQDIDDFEADLGSQARNPFVFCFTNKEHCILR